MLRTEVLRRALRRASASFRASGSSTATTTFDVRCCHLRNVTEAVHMKRQVRRNKLILSKMVQKSGTTRFSVGIHCLESPRDIR